MIKYSIKKSSGKFLLGVPTYGQLKPTRMPEIALVGRSNVGKSSFLNRVLGSKALARISSTPGKTQEINLFQAEISASTGEQSDIIVADLPGFGFAKLSKSERERMSKLTVDYIRNRKELEIVMLLNDSKRLPEKDELSIVKLAIESNRSVILILTKIDRLNQSEKNKALKEISKAYQVTPEQLILSGKEIPVDTCWQNVGARLFGE